MSGPFGPPPGAPGGPPLGRPGQPPPGASGQPPGYYPQQPPGYYPQQAPAGYYQQQGYGSPYGQGQPAPSRTGARPIVAVFIGVLVTLALIAGVVIFLNQPPPPKPPCPPAQPCAPIPSLPPVASSPLPVSTLRPIPTPVGPSSPGASLPPPIGSSDSPPVIAGTLYTDTSLGYGFEYSSDVFTLADHIDGSAVLNGNFFDAQVRVDARSADTSPKKMIEDELALIDRFVIARVPDTDSYDAVLGPSVGYVPGDGSVWSGTLVSRDGSPLAPAGVTIVAASDGRITVAVVVVVFTPDATQGGDTQQHDVRSAADDILKSFKWSVQ